MIFKKMSLSRNFAEFCIVKMKMETYNELSKNQHIRGKNAEFIFFSPNTYKVTIHFCLY